MSNFSLVAAMKAVGSAKSLINRALSFVKNADKVPSSLSPEMTQKIANTARELGYSTKLFDAPILKTIAILDLGEAEVLEHFESDVAAEVLKYTNALPAHQKKLIAAVKSAGVTKVQRWVRAFRDMKHDLNVMLKLQGTTLDKFLEGVKKAQEKEAVTVE